MFKIKKIKEFFFNQESGAYDINFFLSLEHKYSNLEKFSSGLTTIVYKKCDNRVVCLSIDYAKVLYLKLSNIGNFKFIEILEISNGAFVLVYEMDLFLTLSDLDKSSKYKILLDFEEDISDLKKFSDSVYSVNDFSYEDINYLENIYENMNLAEINIKSLVKISRKKYLPDLYFDIYEAQFVYSPNKDIFICIDPILSSNIYV
jgi:hypothetical protein